MQHNLSRKDFIRLGGALALSASSGVNLGCGSDNTLPFTIGTQNTTTNTVTAGIVLQKLGLLDKLLPKTGQYRDKKYNLAWFNAESAPPITNQMIAGKVDIASMGDYPLLVNAATFQKTSDRESLFVAVCAYNERGSGNGIVVPNDSDADTLEDLRGKTVSVPIGSAAHGMLVQALADLNVKPDSFLKLISQSPTAAAASLQAGKIDAHADFVPFVELFPYQGFARKIYDGSQVGVPAFHGITVRAQFARKYPEVVVAYLQAVLKANAWVAKQPQKAAEEIERWTGTPKEVVYIFLGRNGIMTLDPTIKPRWVSALKKDVPVIKEIGNVTAVDVDAFVRDDFLRTAFEMEGLDYEKQRAALEPHSLITGTDPVSGKKVRDRKLAGEIWPRDGAIQPFATPSTLLARTRSMLDGGAKINAAYVTDYANGTKLFADKASYVQTPDGKGDRPPLIALPTKNSADVFAQKNGGTVLSYDAVLREAGT